MHRPSPQELAELRDSQLNVWASLGVYAGVWAVLQVLLRLLDVDMPLVQMFDRFGNLSLPGILVAALLLISAFVPHWILLRRAHLRWFEAARLIREFKQNPPMGDVPGRVRSAPSPSADPAPTADDPEPSAEDAEYWQQRWFEVIKPLSDEDRETRD